MRIATRISAIALGAALVLALYASPASAQKPQTIQAYWNADTIVTVIPGVSPNVFGVDHPAIAAHAANPLYLDGASSLDPNGLLPGLLHFDHILGVAIPGMAGYNPWWDVVLVIDSDTGDLSTYPFTSEAEIQAAASIGAVELVDTGIVLLCQVVH